MSYKTYCNWSGGKDCTLALFHARKGQDHSVEKLLTTVSAPYRRVSMHGLREELLEQQAAAIGLPLQRVALADQPSMSAYEQQMAETVRSLKREGFTHALFGDIFLEDLRRYRESQLAQEGFGAVFPLWKRDSRELAEEFIGLGFKAVVVCTKAEVLDASFAGRFLDRDFLNDLPAGVDPCGENGEFHTFVFDGPLFKTPVLFERGETVYREYAAPKDAADNCFSAQPARPSGMGFWFCDLLPAGSNGQ